jgi:hypothetical protein
MRIPREKKQGVYVYASLNDGSGNNAEEWHDTEQHSTHYLYATTDDTPW